MSAPEQFIATSSRVDFRRLLNTFGFAGEWVLIINHGLRFAGSVQRLGSDFYQIGPQLFSLATVTDIHFTGQGEIIVAIERPVTPEGGHE